jgi:hypothetical protein
VFSLCTMLSNRQMLAIDIFLNSVLSLGCMRAVHMFSCLAYIGNIDLCVWHWLWPVASLKFSHSDLPWQGGLHGKTFPWYVCAEPVYRDGRLFFTTVSLFFKEVSIMLTAGWSLFVPVFVSASPFSLPSILMCLGISWKCTQGKLDFHVAWIRVCTEITSGFTSPSLWLFPNLIVAWHAHQFEQSKKLYCLMNWHL